MSAVQKAWRAFCARNDLDDMYGGTSESKSALLADMGAWLLRTTHNHMDSAKSAVIIVECLGYTMPEEDI